MRVSRSTISMHTYYLHNIPLEFVDSYKYLGVHITTNLSWNTNIDYVIRNANQILGYLRHNFSTAPSSLKKLLYTTLVRPKLEYACAIWDTTTDKLISSLELVQNNSARFILCNCNRTASVSAMKNNLSLTSLSSRRNVTRLVLFHKLFHHPTLRN